MDGWWTGVDDMVWLNLWQRHGHQTAVEVSSSGSYNKGELHGNENINFRFSEILSLSKFRREDDSA